VPEPTSPSGPPIPLNLHHLPVVAGLAVPWITPRLPDGRHLFGLLEQGRQHSCLTQRLCQVCGRPLDRVFVLLARASDLRRRRTAEPPVHPSCAAYTMRVCPMVAGRMAHYRAQPHDLAGLAAVFPDAPARLGAPAEPWFTVWLRSYTVITDPATGALSASYRPTDPLRIRAVRSEAIPTSARQDQAP